jgi:transcriptional regulator MraZ
LLRGVNPLSLDDKSRMVMPSKYRRRLDAQCNGQLIATIDRDDPCLLLYPLPEWEVIEQKLDSLPSFNKQVRRLQRLLIGHATECDMDGQGRILLPTPLREYAGINKRIVLVGQGKKFEIWDEPVWYARMSEYRALEEGDELPAELGSFSL